MNNQVQTPSFRDQFTKMEGEMKMALPVHIPVERFMRVVLTAVNGNPELLQADRQSLFEACMKAAQDGLLPDGREGALVVYNTNVAKPNEAKRWIKKVQWMPMVAGILKKARNSGEIALITAGCVVGGDKFRYWIDDEGEHIFYEPGEKQDFTVFVCAFAMAKTKDGTIYALRLPPADIEKMRNASKAKDGPAWRNWYDQMAMKGAIRRLAKRLPMSSDLDDLIRRDDELYDFKAENQTAVPFSPVKNPLRDDAPRQQVIEHDAGGGDPRGDDGGPPWDGEDESSDNRQDEQENRGEDTGKGASENRASDPISTGSQKAAAETSGDKPAPEGQSTAKTEQAASAGPATAKEAAKPAEQEKPYNDGPTFYAWLKNRIEASTAAGKLTDLWGSTRADRNSLLTDEQIEELTLLKATKLKALKALKDSK